MKKSYVIPSTRVLNVSGEQVMQRMSGFIGNSPDPDWEYRGRTDWD